MSTDEAWRETLSRPLEQRSSTDALKGLAHDGYWNSSHPLHPEIQSHVGDWFKYNYKGKVDLSGGQSASGTSFHFPESRRAEDQRLAEQRAQKAPPVEQKTPKPPPAIPVAPIADMPPGWQPPPHTPAQEKPWTTERVLNKAKEVAQGVLGPAYKPLAETVELLTPENINQVGEWLSPAGDIIDMTEGSTEVAQSIREGDFYKFLDGTTAMLGGMIGTLLPGRLGKLARDADQAIRNSVKLPKVSRTTDPFTGDEFSKLPEQGEIDPNRLRTMQSDIRRNFNTRDKIPLENTIEDIRNGKSIPPVRIAEIDGQVYTLDHRRVVAYREAGKPIPYRKATAEEVQEALGKQKKMTTRNEGMEIRIRGVK